jgi:pimeloyl-ACP methyl ester carboxylesterase
MLNGPETEMTRRTFISQGAAMIAASSTQLGTTASASRPAVLIPQTLIRRVQADGLEVFYREAGAADAPVILLLHGFPASSFQYRELIPRLADRYRVIAPDLPGFGFTEVSAERKYVYSFDSLAGTIEIFTEVLGLKRYALYVFDYGAPTGFRLAMARPDRVTAIISQNAMPTKRVWAMHGHRSGAIGRNRAVRIERRSVKLLVLKG